MLNSDAISEIVFYLDQLNLIAATGPNQPPTFDLTASVSAGAFHCVVRRKEGRLLLVQCK